MDPDELIGRVAANLELYVMSGQLDGDIISRPLTDSAFGDRIADFNDLLVLHYLLESETIEFASELRRRVRQLRTGTATESHITRSEVSSRINWSKTVRERYARNPDDPTLFVTQSRYEEYDLDENIVLQALLERLDAGLESWDDELAKYDWGDDWSEHLLERTRRTIDRNVNLNEIRDPKTGEPTNAMLEVAAQSRHPLYREAAERFLRYKTILSADVGEDVFRDLLTNTLIVPTDGGGSSNRQYSTLFELYVLFAVIETLEEVLGTRGELSPIRRGRNAVGTFELANEDRMYVFYEQAAGSKAFSFLGSTQDIDATSLTRREATRTRTQSIASELFESGSQVATKRPDVLVVYERDGVIVPERSLIIEVKYQGTGSSGKETVERGVRELLEYLAYMRHDDELVFDGSSPSEWFGEQNGLLVVNDDDGISPAIAEDHPISVAHARSLSTQLLDQLQSLYGPSLDEIST